MSRRFARELVVQALYQEEMYPEAEDSMIIEREKRLSEHDLAFYQQIKQGVQKNRDALDQVVGRYLRKGWSIQRLSAVDRAILRLAIYELQYEKETPLKVVLNEAVELAKRFSDPDSARFINGVLANFANEECKKEL